MRRFSPLILGFILATAPVQIVWAAEKEKGEAAKPQTLALEAVALPVIVDGKLLNYVFCNIRLDLYPNADGAKVREKEQFLRDDLVRVGHRTPFTLKNDYTRVDEAKVRAEIMRFAPTVLGAGVVQSVTVTKQSPQKVMDLPRVPQTKPREIIP